MIGLRQHEEWTRIALSRRLAGGLADLENGGPASHSRVGSIQMGSDLSSSWPRQLGGLQQYLRDQAGQLNARQIGDREALYYPWTFQAETPASFQPETPTLIRPIFRVQAPDGDVQLRAFLVLNWT